MGNRTSSGRSSVISCGSRSGCRILCAASASWPNISALHSSLESHNCHPSARERLFRTYSRTAVVVVCMYVWLSMGDARVFLYVRCLFELLPIILPMQGTTARKVHAECVRWLMDSSRWGAQPKKPYLRGNGCLYIFNGFVIHLATDHSHSCERVAVLG